jgi:hypothetical protein
MLVDGDFGWDLGANISGSFEKRNTMAASVTLDCLHLALREILKFEIGFEKTSNQRFVHN